ncbi:MAG: DUF1499 domain-containing protein [Pseudomonadota bacterium]
MIRWIIWLICALIVLAGAGYFWVNLSTTDTARWNVDPSQVTRTGKPNDFLLAPPGTTRALPDESSPVFAETPEELLDRVKKIALGQPRVREIGTGPLQATFEQRSALIGFPDFITVKAVDTGDGAALIVYSRSQYGYSDMGVNKARVLDWLSKVK